MGVPVTLWIRASLQNPGYGCRRDHESDSAKELALATLSGTVRVDTIAGLTAAAVVLPKAMAYATAAGLPVEVDLYTAFLPMVIYALLGSSQVLSVSSTATLAILTATQLAITVPNGDPARLMTAAVTLAAMVGVSIIVSLIALAGQTANPRVSVIGRKRGTDVLRPLSPYHQDDETFKELLILRPEGRIFFINAPNIAERMRELFVQYKPRVVVLDMSRVPDIEYSALQMLIEGEKNTAKDGYTLWLAGLNPDVLAVVRRSGLADQLGKNRLLFNAREAIKQFQH